MLQLTVLTILRKFNPLLLVAGLLPFNFNVGKKKKKGVIFIKADVVVNSEFVI